MPKNIILFFFSFLISQTLFAKIAADEDILETVAKKTEQLEKMFNETRVSVSPKSFIWPELSKFREEIMYIAAHDPAGSISKDTPLELHPTNLTLRFKKSFEALKQSAAQVQTLTDSDAWMRLEKEVESFILNRNQHLYGPARSIIRSGSVVANLDEIETFAAKAVTDEYRKLNINVKVFDPYYMNVGSELKALNHSIKKLKEFRIPPVAKQESIFQTKHLQELTLLCCLTLSLSLGVSFLVSYYKKKASDKKTHSTPQYEQTAFDYYEWLKRLEINLKAMKTNEDSYIETNIALKNYSRELATARRRLNLAESQEDFYANLDAINLAASKVEEHFENLDLKKNTEFSRKTIILMIQLCEAVEKKQEIFLKTAPLNKASQTRVFQRVNLEAA